MESLSAAAPFAPFATALVIAVTFWKNMRLQRVLKQQDVMTAYQKRYEDIRFDLLPRAQAGEYPTDLFILRFWNLQLDQFNAWELGFIPTASYKQWMTERYAEQKLRPINGINWMDGWEAVKMAMGDTPFTAFMDRVLRYSVETAFAKHRR